MKKIFLVVISASFLACGKSKSAKAMAEEICECSAKANDLPTSDPNRSKAQADCQKLNVDAWQKVKEMKVEEMDAFNSILSECASKQIRKSFGQ